MTCPIHILQDQPIISLVVFMYNRDLQVSSRVLVYGVWVQCTMQLSLRGEQVFDVDYRRWSFNVNIQM